MQPLHLGDVVRWRTFIGRVSWMRGEEVGLVSLEGQDGGVVAKLKECEFVMRPKLQGEAREELGRALLQKRLEREHHIRLLRNLKGKVDEVMKRLKEGGERVDEIVKEVKGGKFGG